MYHESKRLQVLYNKAAQNTRREAPNVDDVATKFARHRIIDGIATTI